MEVLNKFFVCPTNCTTSSLGALAVNQDCISDADFFASEINRVFLLPKFSNAGVLNPLPAAMTAAAFNAVIDQSDTTGTKMKYLALDAGIGTPEDKIVPYQGSDRVVSKTYTMEGTILNMNDSNYEFVRGLECGDFVGYIWFATIDHIFGGHLITSGVDRAIELTALRSSIELPTGKDSIQTGKIKAIFKAKTFPKRMARFI